jgi:hypothetical protein
MGYDNELQNEKEGHFVDLDRLRPVSITEVAQRPNHKWDNTTKPPELFEHWWAKNGDKNWSIKHAAREGWYACAESLGVYDGQLDDGDINDRAKE